jgi:hypothetical protein
MKKARNAGVQDPTSYERTIKACETILELTAVQAAKQRTANAVPVMMAVVCVLVLVAYKYVADASMERRSSSPLPTLWSTYFGPQDSRGINEVRLVKSRVATRD